MNTQRIVSMLKMLNYLTNYHKYKRLDSYPYAHYEHVLISFTQPIQFPHSQLKNTSMI